MISVIIPALNESARIAGVIGLARKSRLVNEVIVVDDGSMDSTPEIAVEAGAKVVTSSLLGKGASMEDGLRAARNDIIVYLDGDLQGLRKNLVDVLTEPIVKNEADFVKARFSRSAGRVTTLTARPLLQLFFPELAHFVQPLGGIIAGKSSLLRSLKFETDYGVDLGLLIDAHMQGAKIVEVDIGHLEHDSHDLEVLGEMSKQVVRSLLYRANEHGRMSADQIKEVEEVERHTNAEVNVSAESLKSIRRLAVFDMDGTLLRSRFVVELAKRCGKEVELGQWLDNHNIGEEERSARISKIFEGVERSEFEQTAKNMELAPGAVETVISLRKLGFTVGIVTDSYRVAAEIVRRRVFADFCVANLMRFKSGTATGNITMSRLLTHEQGCETHPLCKQNVILHLKERFHIKDNQVLVVGDGLNDTCMLKAAWLSIAFEPKNEEVKASAQFTIEQSLSGVLELVRSKAFTKKKR